MNIRLWTFILALSVLIAFVASALADDSAADKTVGYYMKTKIAPEWKNWIGGIGVGFWVANKELINQKRAPLFCFSGSYEPDPQAVLDAWIVKERASRGTVKPGEYFGDRLDIEVALLIAYEDSYPCTATKK
jgi:hypothetical protein